MGELRPTHWLVGVWLACASCGEAPAIVGPAAPPAPAVVVADHGVEARRQQLRELVAEQWEYTLQVQPEWASLLGDRRFNDRLAEQTTAQALADVAAARGFLARLDAIDARGFPEQERLSQQLLRRKLQRTIDGARFESWLMPVTQLGGPHLDLPQLAGSLVFTSAQDYDDYLARLRAIPRVLEQVTELMREGVSKGLVPPRVLLGQVAQQAAAVAARAPADNLFAAPLGRFPDSVTPAERVRIRAAVLAAIRDQVVPAYRGFATFVRTEYEPRGRAEVGEWALPQGGERYQLDIEEHTSTRLSADEIHALGLREVERIEGEMNGVARRLGYADLHALAAGVAKDPARHFRSRQQIVDTYRGYIDRMYPRLPELFGRLPEQRLEVVPIEEYREAGASTGYEAGAPDGSRPGRVQVNTRAPTKTTTADAETTAYHEGVPGHHLQIALAQEITGLPPFRQHYELTAFVEGWALYAEQLGAELGMYQDPFSYYGHLQDEMLRAIRLVVDTGLHAKHWTRQQVVDYFHAHGTSDEVEVQSETDRYIAVPGQALGYKIGQLRIQELRAKAQAALGDRFDVRAFHDEILGSGALPLDILGARVDAWIARQRAAAPAAR